MPFLDFDLSAQAYTISTWILPILLAITLHEAAHGIIAWSYGDDTAYKLGRVTLNPLKHVHPFGTVVLPILLYLSPLPLDRKSVVLGKRVSVRGDYGGCGII